MVHGTPYLCTPSLGYTAKERWSLTSPNMDIPSEKTVGSLCFCQAGCQEGGEYIFCQSKCWGFRGRVGENPPPQSCHRQKSFWGSDGKRI